MDDMSDIVERLRYGSGLARLEAADEIERLRARVHDLELTLALMQAKLEPELSE